MNIDGNVNIQQIQACLKEYSTWGETHIVDICTGAQRVIPWGVDVWFGLILLGIVGIAILVVLFMAISTLVY